MMKIWKLSAMEEQGLHFFQEKALCLLMHFVEEKKCEMRLYFGDSIRWSCSVTFIPIN